ncbi:2-succinylbenzoate--CoA ligase, chloroplastic/peroxisomal [Salvia hispanica]|uniref:2-succinylbenzoate--CoA ligase, chloroplastic/peroxisomal n=1 Tax=Salvia hispanica TaxID=49212 RepID=UPI00200922CF|nr:2-succinylbenzoate--CoA ligase, chloroplastic/peroxisomal [Salvia hispanica]
MHSEAHICHCLTRLATIRRDSALTIYDARRKTGMQFVQGVTALARGLLHLGIKPGHVISLSALNSDLYLEWLLAITYVGGIAAPLNYRWSMEEAKSAMEVAQPVMLVTDSSSGFWHSKFNIDSVPSLRWHVQMDAPLNVFSNELLAEPARVNLELDYLWAPENVAIICFTSGTTGRPKGATLSHSALVIQSLAKIAIVGYDEDDVYLHTAPLCHIGGISSALAVLMAGGCHVIAPKFETESAFEAIRDHNVTSLITVPTMMADFISFHLMNRRYGSIESVSKILNGGGGLSAKLVEQAAKVFPRAKILSAYGMTEACSSLTFMTLYDPTKEGGRLPSDDIETSNLGSRGGVCVGKPAPHVELKLCVEESCDGGRILMRGPHTMLYYWGLPPSLGSNPANEGWLDTGDIGRIDEQGNLWLVGRAKDKIKSGGENIYPEEVEGVLLQHPGIYSVVVIGVPDSRLTEMVIGCVRVKEGWQWTDSDVDRSQNRCLSAKILRQFCKDKYLTGFKIPRRFVLWEKNFPLTTTGKLRRDQVRAQLMSHAQILSSKI